MLTLEKKNVKKESSKKNQQPKEKKEFKTVEFFGYQFPVEITKSGKPGKIEKDIAIVKSIFDKGLENITHNDRLILLSVYNIAYHESGKIEGIFSLDSSATNCSFCVKMREYAAKHPEKNIICGSCYDFRQEQYKLQALARHTLNMLIMETIEFTIEELATLAVYGLVRINSSGDSTNNIYAGNMIKFSISHPQCNIAIWSKNTGSYINACNQYGKPDNVTLIQSSVYVDKATKPAKYFDFVFTVYFNENKVNEAIAAGACECNGKKCRDCGYKCYLHGWSGSANIAELLRK